MTKKKGLIKGSDQPWTPIDTGGHESLWDFIWGRGLVDVRQSSRLGTFTVDTGILLEY